MLKKLFNRVKSSPASKIILGLLIGLLFFAIWQFATSHTSGSVLPFMQGNSEAQIPALQAVGIILGQANQAPEMSQQQALLLANQLEASAAVSAQHIDARYILLNYSASNGSAGTQSFTNVPAWLIWYQNVPVQADSPAVDSTPLARTQQDLYVFIDDHTGRELLALWV